MNRSAREIARKWLVRAAVAGAAVASIATSQPLWSVGVELPAERLVPPGRVHRLTVDVSQTPRVVVESDRPEGITEPFTVGDWGPRAPQTRIVLFPGDEIQSVNFTGTCGGGCGGDDDCRPPEGAYARLSNLERFATWTLTDTREGVPAVPMYGNVAFTVDLEGDDLADHDTFQAGDAVGVQFEVVPEDPRDRARVAYDVSVGEFRDDQGRYTVRLAPNDISLASRRFRITATLTGVCLDDGCPVPEGRTFRIVSAHATNGDPLVEDGGEPDADAADAADAGSELDAATDDASSDAADADD